MDIINTVTISFQPYKWECDDGESLNKREEPEEYIEDKYTTIYIHGLTDENKTVCVKISDFKPWVYLELPESIEWNNSRVEILANYLKNRLGANKFIKRKLETKYKLYYMKEGKFLWMTFHNIHCIEQLKRITLKPVTIYGLGAIKLVIHEHQRNASPILKLQAIKNLYPSGWLSVTGKSDEKFSTADIELECSYNDLTPIDKNVVTNPLILSMDLEAVSFDKTGMTFPDPTRKTDPVIVISATVGRYFDTEFKNYALVNESGDREINLPNTLHFENEKELLLGWRAFVNKINPDVIISYNGLSFDDNYLAERASVNSCWQGFSTMGRLIGKTSKRCERQWSSSAYGDQKFKYLDIPGRLHIDMFPVISKEFTNLNGYRLDDVSEYFLNEHKIDLPAREMIKIYHEGGSKNMESIVKYCNQDTMLPFKLLKHLNSWISLIEMANVMRIQIFDLITRGQQVRVFTQLYCDIQDKNFIFQAKWDDYKPTDDDKEFIGATVQNPRVGLWKNVATFDFKSLYPSTIIAYNLCFSTFVPENEVIDESLVHKIVVDSHQGCEHDITERKTKVARKICKTETFRFYKAEIRKGLIPNIIEKTLIAREKAKKEMKIIGKQMESDKNENLKIVYTTFDKRQNGLKINSNSVSGNTPIPCLINNKFEYRTIEEIITEKEWEKSIKDNNNQIVVTSNVKVWSDKGWTDVKYVIRHPVKNPLLRVLTHTGSVDCTPEHSLLLLNGDPVNPTDLNTGDELLHVDCPLPRDTPTLPLYRSLSDQDIVNYNLSTLEEEEAFVLGLFFAEGSCGSYGSAGNVKSSWCIYNMDKNLLERACIILNKIEDCVFNICDYGENIDRKTRSGAVYHMYYLKPNANGYGSKIKLIEKYRNLFYDCRKNKRIPQKIFTSSFNVRQAFFIGYYAGDGNRKINIGIIITNNGQIGTAGLYYIMRSLGYVVSISYVKKPNKENNFRLQCSVDFRRGVNKNAIKSILEAPIPPKISDTKDKIIRNNVHIIKINDNTYNYKHITIHSYRSPIKKMLDMLDSLSMNEMRQRGIIIEYSSKNNEIIYQCITCKQQFIEKINIIRENRVRKNKVCNCLIEDRWKNIEHKQYEEQEYTEFIYDLETESHHFAAGVGNMIVHNSMYGGFGSEFSDTPFYPAAACTTAMGRYKIQETIDFVNKQYSDAQLVYGDSVTADTPILVRENKLIYVLTIEELGNLNQWIEYPGFIDGYDKQYSIPPNVETWSSNGWTAIKKVIRHHTTKQIYRIVSDSGCVDVTEDHSLLLEDKTVIKPCELKIGDKLLTGFPEKHKETIYYFSSDTDKVKCQQNYYSLNQNVIIAEFDGNYTIETCNYAPSNAVKRIHNLGYVSDYVYDLETEDGSFQAGIGRIIVHNTDSAMFCFKSLKDYTAVFKRCHELEKAINKIFPPPMYLEFENLSQKFLLLKKKNYIKEVINEKGEITEVIKKGVVSKRRDNCELLRESYMKVVDMVMNEKHIWDIYRYLEVVIDNLLRGKVDLSKLIITKSVKDNYKATNLPHLAVANKMRERGKYVVSGTRIPYIFTVTEKYDEPQYKKAEDPDFYLESKKIEIDYLYYLDKQIANPIDELLEIRFGKENVIENLVKLLRKKVDIDVFDYFRVSFVVN
jgi:DNA polymerase elongation subunit (family B)